MRWESSFRKSFRSPVSCGELRLTRLNIYSALYAEWADCRVLVDPAKIDPAVANELRPDLILVSHESMDHFESDLALRLLERSGVTLCGSWGTMVAVAERLPTQDERWQRIVPAFPGCTFNFGDLRVRVERSDHCEYASPVWFDLEDRGSGFRIADLVDTNLTPEMSAGEVAARPNVLLAPLGIALTASQEKAWEMVQIFAPKRIVGSHYDSDPTQFLKLAGDRYTEDQLLVFSWHEGTTVKGGNPHYDPLRRIEIAVEPVSTPLAAALEASGGQLLDEQALCELARAEPALQHSTNFWYAVACASLQHRPGAATLDLLEAASSVCLDTDSERLTGAYLLALGAAIGHSPARSGLSFNLGALVQRLTAEAPYISYWIIECIGRAAANPALRQHVAQRLDEIADRPDLYDCEPIRRKLLWEVHRLVEFGHDWEGLAGMLARAARDPNPDVRLLAYKTLGLKRDVSSEMLDWLLEGFRDPHDDVLEWVIRAHIDLFHRLSHRQIADVEGTWIRTALLHDNFHVRAQASVLAELCRANSHA